MNLQIDAITPPILRHEYRDADALAAALADDVAARLRDAMAERGAATLVLSGGSTPARFLRRLGTRELDWSRASVTLADERWLPERSERSNARLLRETLFRGAACDAHFVPLYEDAATPEAAMDTVRRRIDALPLPFDVVVLGMGGDGHTASLFPHGDTLSRALTGADGVRVLPMRAPAAPEPRVTLTLPTLLATRHLVLHIEGHAKRAVFDRAAAGSESPPVAHVIRLATTPLHLYWCP